MNIDLSKRKIEVILSRFKCSCSNVVSGDNTIEEPFSQSIQFSGSKFQIHTQTGDIALTFLESGHSIGESTLVQYIIGNEVNTISADFSPDIKGDALSNTGLNVITYLYNDDVGVGSTKTRTIISNEVKEISVPPILLSATVEDSTPNQLDLVFSKAVDATVLGWSMSGTTDSSFDSVSNNLTDSPSLLFTNNAVGTETILLSYDDGIGDTKDTEIPSNDLVSITDLNVTNNIAVVGSPEDIVWNEANPEGDGVVATGNNVESDGVQSNGYSYATKGISNGSIGWFEFTLASDFANEGLHPISLNDSTITGGAWQDGLFAVLIDFPSGQISMSYNGTTEGTAFTPSSDRRLRLRTDGTNVYLEDFNGATWDIKHTYGTVVGENLFPKFGTHTNQANIPKLLDGIIQSDDALINLV